MTKSFKDFGAAGNGSGDDSSAIRQALESGEAIVNDPQSVFRITNPIVVDNDKFVNWKGGRIKVALSSGATAAFTFQTSAPAYQDQTIRISDVDIMTQNARANWGIAIDYAGNPTAASLGNARNHANVHLSRIHVGPWDNTQDDDRFTSGCVRVRNRCNSVIENCIFVGPKHDGDYYPNTRGLYIDGSGEPTNVKVTACTFKHLERGIEYPNDAEGMTVVDCLMNPVGYGILQTGDNGDFANLGYFVRGTHINARVACIDIKNAAEVFITDGEFYGQHAQGRAWRGVRLGMGGTVRVFRVQNCFFQGLSNGTDEAMGVELGNAAFGYITENYGSELQAMVDAAAMSGGNAFVYSRDNTYRRQSDNALITGLNAQSNDSTKINRAWSY
ncbi:hypothetical protein ATO8_19984 [Roseivivax marinus]|uniref:Pectate lyase superfamily protein domain-containing protein n=1 Tax=Roseivivax marinus TaxID=1379903 RepID=W4HDS7_9RHOB|nr:hypothetical protein [Roseivivax marinus]ETW10912.1 hypothetical protein ATO8_19984 [Roseivivax marinus]